MYNHDCNYHTKTPLDSMNGSLPFASHRDNFSQDLRSPWLSAPALACQMLIMNPVCVPMYAFGRKGLRTG
jgi:hypothetical protein